MQLLQVIPASAVIEDSYTKEITLIQNITTHQCTHILSNTHWFCHVMKTQEQQDKFTSG